MPDRVIVCKCGQDFIWTEGEQQFFDERGFPPPVWCKTCRQKRKELRDKNEASKH